MADDGVAFGHPRHADRQRDGQNGGQSLRDHRDGHRHRGHEHVDGRAAVPQADREGQAGQHEDGVEQHVAEAGDLAGQRCGQYLGTGDELRDAPDLGGIAGFRDHADPGAVGHQAGRIGHVRALRQHDVMRQPFGLLLDRHRLAGQRGFVDLQVAALQQAQVRGHLVARGQQDDIARHQLRGVDLLLFPGAQHRGCRGQRAREGRQRAQRLALLDEADDGVEQDDAEDHAGVDPGPEHDLDDDRGQQDVDQRLMELQQEAQQGPLPLRWVSTFGPKSRCRSSIAKRSRPLPASLSSRSSASSSAGGASVSRAGLSSTVRRLRLIDYTVSK
jgi:hypothetical protein